METLKTCKQCGLDKPKNDYHKNKNRSDGLNPICKTCNYTVVKEWKKNNPEKVSAAGKRHYEKHKDKINGRVHAARAANREKAREDARNWRKIRVEADPEKARAAYRAEAERRRRSVKYRLEDAVKSGVRRGLQVGSKAGRKTFDLLGFTADELRKHLEKQFLPDMSWKNYGKGGWHIDHKIPLAVHNYNTPDDIDFKRAWSLSNLQPLWEADNIKKNDKLHGGFQPSLALPANDNRAIKDRIG